MSETQKMSPKGAIIECASCGAHFDEMMPKCPYCGSMSMKGAEAEYMDKLEDVRSDVEELTQVPIEETKKEIKKQGKFVIIVICCILGVLLLLVGIKLIGLSKIEKRDYQADYAWKQENFPILDEMYEQEQYEEMVAFYMQAYEEDKPVGAWEHDAFCSAMDMFLTVEEIWSREAAGEELSTSDYEDLLYMGFRINNYEESMAYTEDEKQRMAPYIERVRADFETRWDFRKYVKIWMERSGK